MIVLDFALLLQSLRHLIMVVQSSRQKPSASTAFWRCTDDYTDDIVPGVWLHQGSKLHTSCFRISLYHYCYQSIFYET